jgi:hypothetical protein
MDRSVLGYDQALAKKRAVKEQFRFGIGEWYGRSFVHLVPEQRHAYATDPSVPVCMFHCSSA